MLERASKVRNRIVGNVHLHIASVVSAPPAVALAVPAAMAISTIWTITSWSYHYSKKHSYDYLVHEHVLN
eukprot:94041-Amphidinium_carterae.1